MTNQPIDPQNNMTPDNNDKTPVKPTKLVKKRVRKPRESTNKKEKNINTVEDLLRGISGGKIVPIPVTGSLGDMLTKMLEEMTKDGSDITLDDESPEELEKKYERLCPIVSEFLDDFMIIGRSPDGREVVMRYSPTKAGYNSLLLLCKKVLTNLLKK